MLERCHANITRYINFSVHPTEDVPLVELMCLAFTRMPGESYRRRLGSLLLYLCDVFRVLINSLACWNQLETTALVCFKSLLLNIVIWATLSCIKLFWWRGKTFVRSEKWRSFRIFCSTEKLASRHKRFSSTKTLAKIPHNSTYVSFWFSLPPQMTYRVLLVISNPNFT